MPPSISRNDTKRNGKVSVDKLVLQEIRGYEIFQRTSS